MIMLYSLLVWCVLSSVVQGATLVQNPQIASSDHEASDDSSKKMEDYALFKKVMKLQKLLPASSGDWSTHHVAVLQTKKGLLLEIHDEYPRSLTTPWGTFSFDREQFKSLNASKSFLRGLGLTFYSKKFIPTVPRIDHDETGDAGGAIEYSVVPLAEWLQSDRSAFRRIRPALDAEEGQAMLDAFRGQAVMMYSSDFNNVTFSVNTIGEEAIEAPEYRSQSERRSEAFNHKVYSLLQQELREKEAVSAQK